MTLTYAQMITKSLESAGWTWLYRCEDMTPTEEIHVVQLSKDGQTILAISDGQLGAWIDAQRQAIDLSPKAGR